MPPQFKEKTDGLVRDVRKHASNLPPRVRYLLAILLFALVFYFFSDSHRLRGPRPKTKHTYVPGPGGEWETFDSIFGFGDSWSATGFYAGGEQPNPDNPLGNPDLPESGKSHPPNWLHYLTMTYNHTFIRTYNIAHGAATIDRTVVPPHQFLNFTHTFREQVDDIFLTNYMLHDPNAHAQWDPERTLFAIWFGVVDISLLVDRKDFDRENTAKMIDAYLSILDDLYNAGARHFLLLTAPPMYLSPSAHEEGHNPFLQRLLIREFNGRLYQMRRAFVDAHTDSKTYIFDTHGLMTKVIQDPSCTEMTQHLMNTTANCGDYDPDRYQDAKPWDWFREECFIPFDQYLWANHLHPTHVFHNATAAAIVSNCMSPQRKNFCS